MPLQAWLLLLGNLFWVLAYDTEYAMVDRDDDLRIGMKTSAITLGRLDVPAIALFYAAYLLIWAWVLAYDTEYAMVDRDDDLKIGMKTSAITLGRWDVPAIAGFYGAFLLSWSALAGLHLTLWGRVALAAATVQALWHLWLIRGREREPCFKAFRLNHWLGLSVFLGVALAR